MPTIRDVAKLAGVSATTVSHVLNESRWVSPETRRAVLDAIQKLNYRPSAIARSLSTNTTHNIGIIVADITNPFFASLVSGVEKRLAPLNHNLIVCTTEENPDEEARYLELLLERRVDGVIVAPTGFAQSLYGELKAQNIPLVFVDRRPPDNLGPVIAVDNRDAGYRAAQHLLEFGHRRIAILARNPALSTVVGRIAGFRQAHQDYHVDVDEDLVVITDQSPDAVAGAARRLLDLSPRPTAIIPTNTVITLGVLSELSRSQVSCPGDISLVCFDDHPWAPIFTPPLTVIAQPMKGIIDAVVQTLTTAIESHHKKHGEEPGDLVLKDVILNVELVVRASCRPPSG